MSNLPAGATADLYIGGSYWPCASLCPSTLSLSRARETTGGEAQRFSAYTGSRYSPVANHRRENQRDISRRKKKGYTTPSPDRVRHEALLRLAAPDGSRCSRLHASFTLPFLRPIHAVPSSRPPSRNLGPPSRFEARRKTRFPPPLCGGYETLCARARFEFVICHFVEMDGFERWLCCRRYLYISFLFLRGRNIFTWCTNDLVSWNLIVILFNYCNCNLGRGGVNFWTFLKFRKNFFFIRVILSWQDKSIIFRGGKKGKNPLNSLKIIDVRKD